MFGLSETRRSTVAIEIHLECDFERNFNPPPSRSIDRCAFESRTRPNRCVVTLPPSLTIGIVARVSSQVSSGVEIGPHESGHLETRPAHDPQNIDL
jgi:hypothetical protein